MWYNTSKNFLACSTTRKEDTSTCFLLLASFKKKMLPASHFYVNLLCLVSSCRKPIDSGYFSPMEMNFLQWKKNNLHIITHTQGQHMLNKWENIFNLIQPPDTLKELYLTCSALQCLEVLKYVYTSKFIAAYCIDCEKKMEMFTY